MKQINQSTYFIIGDTNTCNNAFSSLDAANKNIYDAANAFTFKSDFVFPQNCSCAADYTKAIVEIYDYDIGKISNFYRNSLASALSQLGRYEETNNYISNDYLTLVNRYDSLEKLLKETLAWEYGKKGNVKKLDGELVWDSTTTIEEIVRQLGILEANNNGTVGAYTSILEKINDLNNNFLSPWGLFTISDYCNIPYDYAGQPLSNENKKNIKLFENIRNDVYTELDGIDVLKLRSYANTQTDCYEDPRHEGYYFWPEHDNYFYRTMATQAIYYGLQYGNSKYLPSITVSQAFLESVAGSSSMARFSNNYFGIKQHGDDPLYAEGYTGQWYPIENTVGNEGHSLGNTKCINIPDSVNCYMRYILVTHPSFQKTQQLESINNLTYAEWLIKSDEEKTSLFEEQISQIKGYFPNDPQGYIGKAKSYVEQYNMTSLDGIYLKYLEDVNGTSDEVYVNSDDINTNNLEKLATDQATYDAEEKSINSTPRPSPTATPTLNVKDDINTNNLEKLAADQAAYDAEEKSVNSASTHKPNTTPVNGINNYNDSENEKKTEIEKSVELEKPQEQTPKDNTPKPRQSSSGSETNNNNPAPINSTPTPEPIETGVKWPDNEFTKDIPVPDFGITGITTSTSEDNFIFTLFGCESDEINNYRELLRKLFKQLNDNTFFRESDNMTIILNEKTNGDFEMIFSK